MSSIRLLALLFTLTLIQQTLSAPKRHPFAELDVGGRIINGTLAETKATKHQVSLRRRLNDGYFFGTGHICGGSLIRSNVVLSAGHCIVDQYIYDGTFVPAESLIVVMGNLDRFLKNENTLIFDIKKIVLPLEKFDLSTYDKDVALLFLDGSVPTDHPTVAPIALTDVAVPAGTVCQVTGWGVTEEGYSSDFLMTLDVPIISHEVCVTETLFSEALILDGMMCAGYLEGERDACAGDSGGPLVCNQKLGGIVSWGTGCALPLLPGVYTDVNYWRSWIEFEIAAYETGELGSGEGEGSGGDPGSGGGEIGSGDPGSGGGEIGSGDPGSGGGEIGSGDPGSGEGELGSGEGSGDGDDGAFSITSSVTLISCLAVTVILFNKLA